MSIKSFKQKNFFLQTSEGNRVSINYFEEGSGAPIVLLHGLGGFAETWKSSMDYLSQQYHVYAVDFPAHGLSSRDFPVDTYNIAGMAKVICEFIETVSKTPVHLVANSAGGTIALHIALHSPGLIDKLVLVSPAGIANEISLRMKILTIYPLGEILLSKAMMKVVKILLVLNVHLFHRKYPMNLARKNIAYYKVPGTKKGVLSCLRSAVNPTGFMHPYSAEELNSLDIPTLILWGACDPIVPSNHAEIAQQRISGSHAIIMDSAGHGPQMDRTKEFCDIVSSFLGSGKLITEIEEKNGCNGISYI